MHPLTAVDSSIIVEDVDTYYGLYVVDFKTSFKFFVTIYGTSVPRKRCVIPEGLCIELKLARSRFEKRYRNFWRIVDQLRSLGMNPIDHLCNIAETFIGTLDPAVITLRELLTAFGDERGQHFYKGFPITFGIDNTSICSTYPWDRVGSTRNQFYNIWNYFHIYLEILTCQKW